MILVDTSVWIDHLRVGHAGLATALEDGLVLAHPMVLGELACGTLRNRGEILARIQGLDTAPVASHGEVLFLIESRSLMGKGLGYIDMHLLASVLLKPGTRIWTYDSRLRAAAADLGVGHGQ